MLDDRRAEDAIGDDEQLDELASLVRGGGAVGEEMISCGRSSELSTDQLFLRYLNGRVKEGRPGPEDECMRDEEVAIVGGDDEGRKQKQQSKARSFVGDRVLSPVTDASHSRHLPLNSCRVLCCVLFGSLTWIASFGPIVSYLRP